MSDPASPLGAGDPGWQVKHDKTPGEREGNSCEDLKHSVQPKDMDSHGLGAALLLTQHSKDVWVFQPTHLLCMGLDES